jgi:hypothetical protein
MLLVLGFALAFGAAAEVAKRNPLDWQEVKHGSIMLVPFLIMVGLKFALVVGLRARRVDPEGSTKPVIPDDHLF